MSARIDIEKAKKVVRSLGIDEALFTEAWGYVGKKLKAQTLGERRIAICAACALFTAKYCGLPVSTKAICLAFDSEFPHTPSILGIKPREALRIYRKIYAVYKGPHPPTGDYLRKRWVMYIGAKLGLPLKVTEDAAKIVESNKDYAQGKEPAFIAGAAVSLACHQGKCPVALNKIAKVSGMGTETTKKHIHVLSTQEQTGY